MATGHIRGQLLSEELHKRDYLGLNSSSGEFQTITEIHSLDNQKSAELLQSLSDLAAKNLRHPNFITYLGHSQSDSSIIILSEYVIGFGSISTYVQEHGKFEEIVASSFTRQILEGLVYLDEQGVSVGNLSAKNILVDLNGTVKIAHYALPADLGQSQLATDLSSTQIEKGLGAKADFWTLGSIVLQMLTDYPLWSEATRSLHDGDKIPERMLATLDTPSSDFVTKCFSM